MPMDPLEKLAQQAPGLEFELPDGAPVIRLGLASTLYFKEGYTTAVKEKIIECFERFYEEFEAHLNWQVAGRPQKLSRQKFDKHRDAILSSGPNDQCEWHISSARNQKEAGVYSLSLLTSFATHGDKDRSYLKLTLPWDYLNEPDGKKHFHEWLLFLVNKLAAESGYSGLACKLPYDFASYMPMEYQLAQQYSGLEVDTFAFSMGRELCSHIKGVNWYTVLGQTFVERLGGEETVRQAFAAHPDIKCINYDNGLIVRAGEYPELGAQEDGLPRVYVAVNRVVKPVRIPNPDQLHSYSPYGDCFDQESSARWYARFDEEQQERAIPEKIYAGQPCSHAGYWSTPASAESRQFFNKGEVMPNFEDSDWGATIWYWAGGDTDTTE